MRTAFPAALFDGAPWEHLLARATAVPASAITDVFGFEIHLGRPEPAADFCIVVPPGGEVASHFIGLSRPEPGVRPSQDAVEDSVDAAPGRVRSAASDLPRRGPPFTARRASRRRLAEDSLAACLREIASAGTFANHAIAHGVTMLEYDVMDVRPGSHPSPGIFWTFGDHFEPSHVGELARLLAMASGLPAPSTRREGPSAVPREAGWAAALRGFMDAATPYGRVSQAGTFVGRARGDVRIVVKGVEPDATARLLDAVRWSGSATTAMDAVAACALPGTQLGVALDVGLRGVGPRLGLELSTTPGGWIGSRWRHWRPFLDLLVAIGWCREDKLLGLKRWSGLKRLFDRRMYYLACGINHVKIVIEGDAVEAKAYLGACRRSAEDVTGGSLSTLAPTGRVAETRAPAASAAGRHPLRSRPARLLRPCPRKPSY